MSIYNAKFMNEASTNLASRVIMNPVTETYLFSTLNILREMNTTINDKTKNLYISIAEAESKEEENKLFAKYFYEFKNIFEQFSDKVNQMKSRMIISVENKVDTWNDLIKDDSYINNFNTEFSYSGYDFTSVQDSNYPRMNIYKIYQKEFDYLGALLQDKSIEATPSAKMKIIATVSNNFSNYACNKDWSKNIIKDMIDISDNDISNSYSECIINALRRKTQITVNKGVLYNCKENLCNYEDIIDACVKMCDELLCDINKVSENISSYLFRNEDKKLKIKTDTDGIIDRDYRLDTYSMNQLNLFLKNKCNQIKKVLTIYSIAIAIKFDTAADYIDQCINILKSVKCHEDDKNLSNDIENTDDLENETEDIDDKSTTDTELDNEDDNNEDHNEDEVELSPYKKLSSMELDDDSDDFNDDDFNDNEKKSDDSDDIVMDDDTEKFDEAYLFESELFELEMFGEMYAMHEAVVSLLEEEQQAKTGSDNKTSNINYLANQYKSKVPDIIQSILNKIKELWNKFKDFAFNTTKKKIEYLKSNSRLINVKVTGKIGLDYNADMNFLNSINIPDLNYESMKDSLESEESFYKNLTFYGADNEGRSISDYIKQKALGEKQEATENLETINPSINEAYKFCINYPSKVKTLDNQIQKLNKAEKYLQSKLKESTIDNNFNNYFLELDTSEDTSTVEKKENVSVYFRVCSQIIAAQMTVYQSLFNEYYKYCEWHIKKAGGSTNKETKKEGNTEGK